MAKNIQKFNAIIMSRQSYGESDLLVKFLTDRFGKKMFLLRRAKKPGFRFAAGILPFTIGTYSGDLREQGLSYLVTVNDVVQLHKIADDIDLNAYATYILGLLDLAFQDGQPVGRFFAQIEAGLRLIDQGLDAQVITNIMEVQMLQPYGVAPNWQGCVIDGRTDLPLDFSEAYGGLLCQEHWGLDPHRDHASARAIFLLRRFSQVDLSQLQTISVKPETKAELRKILDSIYQNMVGVTPKAKRFLDQMQHWQDRLPDQP